MNIDVFKTPMKTSFLREKTVGHFTITENKPVFSGLHFFIYKLIFQPF